MTSLSDVLNLFISPLDTSSTYPRSRVAASVTIYNSKPACLEVISTYRDQVERIYVVDNSEQPDQTLITRLTRWPTVQYVGMGGNKGVANALNEAARLAIIAGFDFLLTMDDDTALPPGTLSNLVDFATSPANNSRVGIVSGVHSTVSSTLESLPVLFTMTSGNLLNLAIYQKVGSFRDDFFIDHVDHEYGLRLNQNGYQVIELPGIRLQHQLGNKKLSGWGTFRFVSHTPLRGYYMMRNGLVTAQLYPTFRCQAFVILTKEWLKALFFEDQKGRRLTLLWQGFRDARYGRLGKFNE